MKVHGDEQAQSLAPKLERWCTAIARFLGVELAEDMALELRAHAGIPRVEGGTVYLPEDASGRLDLTHAPHELVHVVAGLSPSRFLSEGVAVHADAHLQLGGPCWPCYRLAPDQWMVNVLARPRGAGLEAAITDARGLRLDHEPHSLARAWRIYVIAGSFTRFLLRASPSAFWEGYRAGACWEGAGELLELERRWQAQLPRRLSDHERNLMQASAQDARRALATVCERSSTTAYP